MSIEEDNDLSFRYFDFFIKVLAAMHWLWLLVFRYYYFDISNSHRLPVFDFLDHDSPALHLGVFFMYTLSVLLFILRKVNYQWSFLIALSLFYFEFHDKYSFHHDIFLGINVFFLFGFIKFHHLRKNYKARADFIFAIKVLCSLVYLFAGIHKLNEFFDSGNLLKDMLSTGILRFFLDDVPLGLAKALGYFTLLIEMLFPVLIWTKWKRGAVSAAVLLHFGIAIFGERGMLFNMYLPCMWLFFFTFSQKDYVEYRIKKILLKMDIFQFFRDSVMVKRTNFKEFKGLSYNFIWLNPIFLILFVAFLFNLLILTKKMISDFM